MRFWKGYYEELRTYGKLVVLVSDMVVMKKGASSDEIDRVIGKIEAAGCRADVSRGKYKTVIGAIGDREKVETIPFEAFSGVEKIIAISAPFKFVSREYQERDTVVTVGSAKMGGGSFAVLAGPCSIENEEQLYEAASVVKKGGAAILRGGAFKPRSSPYSFQGLGEQGLKLLKEARKRTGLPVCTEVMDVRDLSLVAAYADILQIGARNMQNFQLLTEVGKIRKPVLLKRSFGCTIEELLMAAEYIVKGGNKEIILCERGIRTFESAARNTLDISAIPIVRALSHLPIIVDPSHAAGKRELVEPLSLAALAAGADGIMVEVHPHPEDALCDGSQSLTGSGFENLMRKVHALAGTLGKEMSG
ncbi:MAG: 3-deoxy-7-phosphoheptulonate synthase [Terriglobia bacterium]